MLMYRPNVVSFFSVVLQEHQAESARLLPNLYGPVGGPRGGYPLVPIGPPFYGQGKSMPVAVPDCA